MQRILIVEDDPAVVVGLSDFVRALGYDVAVARDGRQALQLYASHPPDLVLLDLVLPKKSGAEVCRTIREQGDTTPIIMVTAKTQPHDRVAGLDLGADDYVTKPFDLEELAARIRAVTRRATPSAQPTASVHRIGDARVDLQRFTVERDGKTHRLRAREREMLALLIVRRGEVVTRNDILDEIWGTDRFPTTRTVDNYIVSLRKMLQPDPASPRLLLSVRGAGYQLVADEHQPSSESTA